MPLITRYVEKGIFYKILLPDGRSRGIDDGLRNLAWPLPNEDGPGSWMPELKGTLHYPDGYWLFRLANLPYRTLPAVFEAEATGEIVEDSDKILARRARLLRRFPWDTHKAVQFATLSTKHVIWIYESAYPDDSTPREAVEVLLRWVDRTGVGPEDIRTIADQVQYPGPGSRPVNHAFGHAPNEVLSAVLHACTAAIYATTPDAPLSSACDAVCAAVRAGRIVGVGDQESSFQENLLAQLLGIQLP